MTAPPRAGLAGRCFAVVGGVLFVTSLAYFLIAYWQFGQPAGPWDGLGWRPVASNTVLFTLFALHHSVFARTGIKIAISSRVSMALERSVYVWIASLLFFLTLGAWEPVPGVLWNVTGVGAWVFGAGWIAGLLLTAVAASALDPLDLAGIRQAFGRARAGGESLTTTGIYGIVRHPIYVGWILLVWSVPVMTGTRLVFAAVSTAYLIVAIPFEERQMLRTLRGYNAYATVVRWRLFPGVY